MKPAWLLRLYPRRWRLRYEEEYLALLEELPLRPDTLLDILRGAVVAFLAVLAGGWPIVQAALQYALRSARRNLPFFAVPLISAAVLLAGFGLLIAIVNGRLPAPEVVAEGLFLVLVGLFLVAVVTSTASICVAVVRSEIRTALYRHALIPGTAATVCMAIMLTATFLWGIRALMLAPDLFLHDHFGLFGATTAASWVVIVALMLVTTGLAAGALQQSYSAPPDSATPSPGT